MRPRRSVVKAAFITEIAARDREIPHGRERSAMA